MIQYLDRLPTLNRFLILLTTLILTLTLVNCQGDNGSGNSDPEPTAAVKLFTRAVLNPPQSVTSTVTEAAAVTEEIGVIRTRVTATASPTRARVTPTTTQPSADEPSATPKPTNTRELPDPPEGALISVSLEGQVGVLLDERRESYRDDVASGLMDRAETYWDDLARRQVRLTKRRLNFRNFIYAGRGQLPLPPESLWSITLDPAGPERLDIEGHDVVLSNYVFSSTLLTDVFSPAEAEPRLGVIGGTWEEPFVLPVDPLYILQRTDNACMNESGFPPNSVDSENAWIFYDYTCQGNDGGILGCHRTRLHPQSCVEALKYRVGTIRTEVRFERLEWDDALADRVRVGDLTHEEGPDLKVVGEDLEINRIIYRYFQPDSCALAEECVKDSGWRRLLQFSATVHNVGAVTLEIGRVVSQNPLNNLFQYNSCHAHYHFSDYGDFYFSGEEDNLSSKQAFCVESTNRLSNNEWAPLTHNYTCSNQGVQAGWVDEYVAGLDCQWLDITDIEVEPGGSSYSLGFLSNPDRFLCEGEPVLDANGNLEWEATDLIDPNGLPLNRPLCDFVSDWDVNNDNSIEINIKQSGSYVTDPCEGDQLGELRNCGFTPQINGVEIPRSEDDVTVDQTRSTPQTKYPGSFSCDPGERTLMSCSVEDDRFPQVLRLCEFSAVLGVGLGCTYQDSLANDIVGIEPAEFSFTCPFIRDEQEPGGLFALYTAPLVAGEVRQTVSCEVIP